jgi:outer membrane protein assembly factor BamB
VLPLLLTTLIAVGGDAPKPLWTFQTGGQIWSSAVHDGGVLYFGSDDDSLYAVDLNGQLCWKFTTGGRVRSTPAVGDDLVLFASDDGFLYALKRDGSERWRFDLEAAGVPRCLPAAHPPFAYDYTASSPVLDRGVVFIGSASGALFAVDASTGKERWRFATGGPLRSTPALDETSVTIGSWDGHLYRVDRESGKEAWSFDTGGVLQASPTLADGLVIIGSRNPRMVAVEVESGELAWEHRHADGSWVESTGILAEGTLIVGSSDARRVFAFAADTGDLQWSALTGGWAWSRPVLADGIVYSGNISAAPYPNPLERGLVALDALSGERLWRFPTAELPGFLTGGVFASPVIMDGVIFFGALDGTFYALGE